MAPRLKAPAQAVPQNILEAEALAVELVDQIRRIDRRESKLASKIAELTLEAKIETEPLGKSIKAKFKALTAFAAAHRTGILPEGRKSLQIAAGTIGWRLGNPRVEIEDGMEEDVIDRLNELGLSQFLRETVSIDKPAVLADPDTIAAAEIEHLSIVQDEVFFFRPLEIDLEQKKTVGKVPVAFVQDAA